MSDKNELTSLVRMARKKAQDEGRNGPTEAVRAISTIECHLQGDNVAAIEVKVAAKVLKEYIDA